MAFHRLLMSSALAMSLGYAIDSHAQTNMPAGNAKPGAETSGAAEPAARVQKANEMRADRLIGSSVRNPQNENIGKVSDLVLDEKGATTDVVISVGGFLGIGDKHVAVPWSQLQVQEGGRNIVLGMSKDELKAAPAFKTREAEEADRRAETERQRARDTATPRPNTGGAPVR
jgi:sporulation protein YlmC with PRC-barrel domain